MEFLVKSTRPETLKTATLVVALGEGRKLGAAACVVLVVSLFLPWFQKSVLPQGAKDFVKQNLTAFGSFSWIEAALLLVVGAVTVWEEIQLRRDQDGRLERAG